MASYPWERNYPPNLSWSEPFPAPFALEGLLAYAAYTWPTRSAVDFYDKTLSFSELHQLASRAAKNLQELGIKPGMQVGLHLPNTPHYLIYFFATLMAGGRVANFNPSSGFEELRSQLVDSEAMVLVTADWLPIFGDLCRIKDATALRTVIVCRLGDFLPPATAQELARAPASSECGLANEFLYEDAICNDGFFTHYPHRDLAEEVAVLQYTGGTTGEPKGAMLTHANFAAVMHMLGRWAAAQASNAQAAPAAVPGGLKVLGVLPLFHIYGLNSIMLPTIAAGNELILHLRFDPSRVLSDIHHKRVNLFSAVPAMYASLMYHPRFAQTDFSSLLGLGSGGAPLPFSLRKNFEEITGRVLAEGYALTEVTGFGTIPHLAGVENTGQVGLPAPHTIIDIVDLETGNNVLPLGELGEVCFRGPQVMKGYWRKPDENTEAFRGGRFHTGDIGFLDENGRLTLTERKKDVILVGGHNVYPSNIERAIAEHPTVLEVSVIGVPHPTFGQVAKAFIAPKPNCEPLTYRELCAFLTKKLASYELPAELEIRGELPKTAIGKLSKKQLIAEESARREAVLGS